MSNIKIVSSEAAPDKERFIEITPEMLAAGLNAYRGQYFSQLEIIKAVYKAMRRLERT